MSNWKPYKDGESCYWDKLEQGLKNTLGNAGAPRAIEVDHEGYHYKVAQYNGKDGSQFWSVFRKPLPGTTAAPKPQATTPALTVDNAAMLGLLNEIAVNTRAEPEGLAVQKQILETLKQILEVAKGNVQVSEPSFQPGNTA